MPAFPPKTNYAAGDVLTAAQMNDVGNALSAYQFTVGKNKIINGDFRIWQRGTSFSGITGATYTADRWRVSADVAVTASQQTFTPGTAPVAGYEGQFFHRIVCGATTAYVDFSQFIEDVRTFAGQTVTLSFWAKSSANVTWTVFARQNFGSGGSASVDTGASTTAAITTSWQRFTMQISVPSVSGKTIGTSSYLGIIGYISGATANSKTLDFWGVQVEAGSTATPFTTATGTLAGEFVLCQRYYYQWNSSLNSYTALAMGIAESTTVIKLLRLHPVSMRTTPTITVTAPFQDFGGNGVTVTASLLLDNQMTLDATAASAVFTAWQGRGVRADNSLNAKIQVSAEL